MKADAAAQTAAHDAERSPDDAGPYRARVAMVVANEVTVDTRVRKYAESVSALGYDVTVFGVTAGPQSEELIGQAKVVRLNLKTTFRDRSNAWSIPTLGFRDQKAFVKARSRNKIRERELVARIGQEVEHGDGSAVSKLRRRGLRLMTKANSLHRRIIDDRWARGKAARPASLTMSLRQGWRHLIPETDDWEMAVGPALDAFDADIIHAHDVHLLGVAVRARDRAAARGRAPVVIYDAHEFIPGLDGIPEDYVKGFTKLEADYIDRADQIITVSPLLAEWLERDHSPERPVRITLNTPALAWRDEVSDRSEPPSVRVAAGLGEDDHVVVYSGGYNSGRGIVTLVEAMEFVEHAELVLVSQGVNSYLAPLLERANERGYRDRIHLVPFVEPQEVPLYLSSADVGVHPMLHALNHEVALPNKFFEYLHGHVPIVVSDVESMADFTLQHRVGEVFPALDAHALAERITKVLADPDCYRKNITEELLAEHSWERQSDVLRDVYRQFADPVPYTENEIDELQLLRLDAREFSLYIGPANFAGQAGAWARAVRELSPHNNVASWAIHRNNVLNFPSDYTISPQSWRSMVWQIQHMQRFAQQYSHALMDAGLGVLGTLNGGNFDDDAAFLRAKGIRAGVIFHGSEIRQPELHRRLERWSPFTERPDDYQEKVAARAADVAHRLTRFDGQVFVTTLDLLDYVDNGAWLPTVVDCDAWASDVPVLERKRPVVVHAPTNRRLKGTEQVEPLMRQLDDEGVIEYRPVSGVAPDEMREVVKNADVIVDQFAIGDYGVTSAQALAAGRVVIAHVDSRCRDRLQGDLPIVEATPDDFEDVLRRVLESREETRRIAESGIEFARRVHGGHASARQILRWIDGAEIPAVPPETQQRARFD